ncbi:hypothetical protein [Sulfitobacter sp. JL08]|nr:hypothetical protein [Sulfitobacter sp. JL08]
MKIASVTSPVRGGTDAVRFANVSSPRHLCRGRQIIDFMRNTRRDGRV